MLLLQRRPLDKKGIKGRGYVVFRSSGTKKDECYSVEDP